MRVDLPPDDAKHKENEAKRLKYIKGFLERHPLEIKNITEEEIPLLKRHKLIAVFRPGRMGTTSCNFALLQDNGIHFYTTDDYNHDGYGTIIKTFPGFEKNKNGEAKDYEFVAVGFGGGLFVNKGIFKDYNNFVNFECNYYDLGTARDLRYNREPVMLMYYNDLANKKFKGKGECLRFD